jgi:pimeloyl-ACP methyl ester carboxylesterase
MTRARLSSLEFVPLPDGRVICARRRGRASERPVVLVHGLLDSSEGWLELCRELRCPYVAVDLPGFGHSDGPSHRSIAGYAHDLAEVLRVLGLEEVTLVGHSLGGAVATAVAELMPGSVRSLVLLAPVGFGRIPLAEAALLPGVRALVHAALPHALSSPVLVTAGYAAMVTNGRTPRADLVDRLTGHGAHLARSAEAAIRAIASAGRSADAFHRRRVDYDGPVVAVWGDRDRLVPPSHQRALASSLPQARIEVWRGMGHHPMRERLGDLAALISTARERQLSGAGQQRPGTGTGAQEAA